MRLIQNEDDPKLFGVCNHRTGWWNTTLVSDFSERYSEAKNNFWTDSSNHYKNQKKRALAPDGLFEWRLG